MQGSLVGAVVKCGGQAVGHSYFVDALAVFHTYKSKTDRGYECKSNAMIADMNLIQAAHRREKLLFCGEKMDCNDTAGASISTKANKEYLTEAFTKNHKSYDLC